MDREPDDDEDDDNGPDSASVSQGTSTHTDSVETEDSSRPSSAMSKTSHGKKRRRANPLVPSPQVKTADFWSMVEKWFAARMRTDQLGTTWNSPGWVK